MTTPASNPDESASAHPRTCPVRSTDHSTPAGAVPSALPVELTAFLDLVAELIAAAIWQEAGGSTPPDESRAPHPDGHGILPSSEAGNGDPIPSFPADSRLHSRSSATASRRATRRAPPKETL
jgi:hypothetical protein